MCGQVCVRVLEFSERTIRDILDEDPLHLENSGPAFLLAPFREFGVGVNLGSQ